MTNSDGSEKINCHQPDIQPGANLCEALKIDVQLVRAAARVNLNPDPCLVVPIPKLDPGPHVEGWEHKG